jgi:hypothetical protein
MVSKLTINLGTTQNTLNATRKQQKPLHSTESSLNAGRRAENPLVRVTRLLTHMGQ